MNGAQSGIKRACANSAPLRALKHVYPPLVLKTVCTPGQATVLKLSNGLK
ncbi:hypothetical protein PISMIDRAFT_17842 [Pisolithus microcarpus 441]|uniref:Unplaced genomic scaffold scaffold_299, whole genome shotgun sequence n=1 Tax=Pisolithus microcarpus 441 TaxID=765257 RepID=A0A0C9YTL8_9AGAM|nr:hypothetical protein PISMIDRAFT_17842 [Pisolithus microcarpus 441]